MLNVGLKVLFFTSLRYILCLMSFGFTLTYVEIFIRYLFFFPCRRHFSQSTHLSYLMWSAIWAHIKGGIMKSQKCRKAQWHEWREFKKWPCHLETTTHSPNLNVLKQPFWASEVTTWTFCSIKRSLAKENDFSCQFCDLQSQCLSKNVLFPAGCVCNVDK